MGESIIESGGTKRGKQINTEDKESDEVSFFILDIPTLPTSHACEGSGKSGTYLCFLFLFFSNI